MKRSFLMLCVLLSAACSKPQQEPADDEPLTAAACEAKGGTVVGDIGDGAIHKPGYRCSGTNAEPLGAIVADPGAPQAVEGAVCCPSP